MSATVFCPSCGDEYVAGSTFCSDCRVALVSERPVAGTAPGGTVMGGPAGGGLGVPGGEEPAAVGYDTPGGPGGSGGLPEGYVEIGSWPPLAAVMLVRRLVDADVPVSAQWSDPSGDDLARLAVPRAQIEFADAVIRELPVEDELPDGDLSSYVLRIEARLAEIALLLDELRLTEEFGGGDA